MLVDVSSNYRESYRATTSQVCNGNRPVELGSLKIQTCLNIARQPLLDDVDVAEVASI